MKKYACSTCGRKFGTERGLKIHSGQVHREPPPHIDIVAPKQTPEENLRQVVKVIIHQLVEAL